MTQNYATTPFIGITSSPVLSVEKRLLSEPSTPDRAGVLRGGAKHVRTHKSPFTDDIDAAVLDSIDVGMPSINSFPAAQSEDMSIAQGSQPQNSGEEIENGEDKKQQHQSLKSYLRYLIHLR